MSNDAMSKEVPMTNAQQGCATMSSWAQPCSAQRRISGCELRSFAECMVSATRDPSLRVSTRSVQDDTSRKGSPEPDFTKTGGVERWLLPGDSRGDTTNCSTK